MQTKLFHEIQGLSRMTVGELRDKLDNYFEFEGRCYRSLSAIARKVAGTKWNGFLFFGIDQNRRTSPRAKRSQQ